MKNQILKFQIFAITTSVFLLASCTTDQGKSAKQSIFQPLRIKDSIRYVGQMNYSAVLSTITGYKKDTVYADTVVCIKKTEDSVYCYWRRIKVLDDSFRNQTFTAALKIQDGDQYVFPDDDKTVRYNLQLLFSKEELEIVDTFAIFFEHSMDAYHFKGKRLE